MNSLIIQSKSSARGRLYKRPRAELPSFSDFSADSAVKSLNSPRKRPRRTSQLPQFRVYQDQILSSDTTDPSGQNEPTPSPIGPQLNKIWPHISVEISFRPEFHSISVESASKQGIRRPLASLSSIAINGAKKAPKIPRKWIENQPNDHTSMLFLYYFIVLHSILLFIGFFN